MSRRFWAWMVAALFGALVAVADINNISDYLVWVLIGTIFYGIYEWILEGDEE